MTQPFEELDRKVEALRAEHPGVRFRTYEEMGGYFALAAATCEFTAETENRFWDRADRLVPPGTDPWEAGRAWMVASSACIMASGLGSARFVMPEAAAQVGDPAWALAEFMDIFARTLERRPIAARRALIEKLAAACEGDPMALIDNDDVTSVFRNLRRLVEEADASEP